MIAKETRNIETNRQLAENAVLRCKRAKSDIVLKSRELAEQFIILSFTSAEKNSA